MKAPDEFERRAIVVTFCLVILMVFGTLLVGLFNASVDNDEIFKMMTHAFDMIMVGLTGYLGGRASVKKDDHSA